MMMLGLEKGVKEMFSHFVPSKHHDSLLKMGFNWHENKQYYTDAYGKIIPQEIEFNESGHYFDGQHYRDAYCNIVDD